jgi:HSP20 family protein
MSLSLFGYSDPFIQMDNLFDNFWGFRPLLINSLDSSEVKKWRPAFDVKETEKEFIIQADLPGVNKEDLKVELHEGTLTISGERKYEKKEENEKGHRLERAYGSFTRSFVVPEDLKEDQIKASFNNGVLEITFPKPIQSQEEQNKPKIITIQ